MGNSFRPCTVGHLLICTLGIFGLVGRLIDARHHDASDNGLQQHELQYPPLGQQKFLQSSSSSSASLSGSSKEDG